MKYYWFFILFTFHTFYSNAQCSSCTITNPNATGNYTFTSGSTVCFTSDETLNNVTFENNSKVCVAPGVKLEIKNNVNTTNGHDIEFEIGGILEFRQVPQINANLKVNISSGGILKGGNNGTTNFFFNGNSTEIINNGSIQVGVLQFQNNNSTNIIDNYNDFDIASNINIQGTTTFRNFGTIAVGSSFNSNSNTTYINCGLFSSSNGFNLQGGKVINTGTFNILSGQIDMPNGSEFDNYGTVVSNGSFNNNSPSSILYNEGLFQLNNYQGNGWIKGPDSSSKKGYFEVNSPMNTNFAKVGPNLDFKRNTGPTSQSTVFNNNLVTYVDSNGNSVTQTVANVSFDCVAAGNCGAPQINSGIDCPSVNGEFSDLSISYTVDNSTPVAGNNVTFTIMATNNGPGNNTNIEVQNLLPNGYTIANSNTSTGLYDEVNGVWNIGSLNNGDTATLIITATVEATGIYSYLASIVGDLGDLDPNNNEVNVMTSPVIDTDGDNIPNDDDLDDDNDGILDTDEGLTTSLDTDSDGIPDHMDLDSDNDGIADIIEAGGVDINYDGVVDVSTDTDNDGWADIFDSDNGGTALSDTNSDGVGQPDRRVLDSDSDGCSDANEYYQNANKDGNANGADNLEYGTSAPTVDGNGMVIAADYNGSPTGLSDAQDNTITNGCVFLQIADGNWDDGTLWREQIVPTFNNSARINNNVTSTVSQNQQVKNLFTNHGSEVIINNFFTLKVKGNITNEGEFKGEGEVILDGASNQSLFGTGDYENLRLDNANGVDVKNSDFTDPTGIKGKLFVEAGEFKTNNNVLLPCSFEELGSPGSGDFANAKFGQIGPILGSSTITGDVTVEQCFPGRRAFRFVSPSNTTTTSIHENWQEGATNYDDIPVPSEIQEDGIEFGYGTHITGVEPDPNTNAPITPTPNSSNNGLDWQPSGNASMFTFSDENQAWENFLDTAGTTLSAGDAYRVIIRGSREVDLTDNTSDVSNTKLRSTGTIEKGPIDLTPNISNGQFALIGNPFHAIIDLSKVFPSNSGYTPFVYAFDPKLGGVNDANTSSNSLGGRGAFVTIEASTGNKSVSAAPSGFYNSEADKFLQPYQAFFVQANNSNPNKTIIFEEADKAVNQNQADVFSTGSTKKISFTLFDNESYNTNSTPDDGFVIFFSPNGNNAVDVNDAPKFPNQDEIISRNENGSLISFENRAMPQNEEILDIFVMNYRATNYVMLVNVEDLPEMNAYLYDNYTDTETLLTNNATTNYSFTIDLSITESTSTDRFELRFRNSTLGNNEFDKQEISVFPNPAQDVLNISFGNTSDKFDSLELYDINGRLITTRNLSNQLLDVQIDLKNFNAGVYVLKLNSGNKQFSSKVIIE